MKYLFILGRNVDLSLAEIFSYFGNQIQDYKIKDNAVLIDLEKPIGKIIDNFGGIIAIGKVLCEKQELEKQELYSGTSNKLNYCIWNFSNELIDEVSSYLKKRFRSEKLKATEKIFTGSIKLQSGETVPNLESKLINKQFFVFENYFGEILETCDYKKLEKRDMSRPIRRESLSISPRLAKIMINLSQVKKQEKLVDPFCGVGVILQEALLQNIKVIGIDKDSQAINGARKNLEYQKFSKNDYTLVNNDSTKVSIGNVNALVAEPDLGETLKKIPTKEKAQKMLNNYEKLMIKVINNLKKNISGKIVFTAPFIRIGKNRLSCSCENILEKTDLKLSKINNIKVPIEEFRENQIVGREIFILEK